MTADVGATVAPVRAEPNALGRALGLLGDEWTLLIVRSAFEGARRYGDWKAALPISDAVLSARLRSLVDAEVLRAVPTSTTRHEYALTRRGVDLWRLLLAIWDWERRHAAGQADRLPVMVHAACCAEFRPVLGCVACGAPSESDQVDAVFGPSGGFERCVPVGSNRRRTGRPRGDGPDLFPETMAVIGSRWSAAVVGSLFLGATRFSDVERALSAPPAVVADRLRAFVAAGVLVPDESTRDYRLTVKGRDLFGVVVALLTWAERWTPSPDGPAVVATHRVCRAAFLPRWTCSACGEDLRADSVIVAPHRLTERRNRPSRRVSRATIG